MRKYIEVESQEQAQKILQGHSCVEKTAFQCVDFTQFIVEVENVSFRDCLFLGCKFTKSMHYNLDGSNVVLTSLKVPYNVFKTSLYTAKSLYEGYDWSNGDMQNSCYDARVYKHYLETGKRATDINETLARTLHDHSMSEALHDYLSRYKEKEVVAIMGGHALLRSDKVYRQIVEISKKLTEQGKLMVSGGGPGAMEATHLGAWMAGRTMTEVDEAMKVLVSSESFTDPDWLSSAFEVIERFPQSKYESLGIPTWLYGHEPATPFATHIAKYFENSLREDGLLTIAKGGVIYTPGSAGTMQEIFQDAVQNHYLTFGYASPMVFLDVDYWTKQMPAYTLLEQLQGRGRYKNLLLSITDNPEEIVQSIMNFK